MILTCVLFAVLLGIASFIYENLYFVSTDDAQIGAHTFELSPRIGGFIVKVNVDEGQTVQKGAVLAEIDSREYVNLLKENEALRDSIAARFQEIALTFKRTDKLFKSGATTVAQYDNDLANKNDMQAQLNVANVHIAQAKLNLEFTQIKAPTDGFIAKRSVEVGQFAGEGVPLFGFTESGERWVEANFKETEIRYIKPGQQATITVDAFPGREFQGVVSYIGASTGATFTLLPPDNASGNFTKIVQRVPVRVQFEKVSPVDLEQFRVGLSAVVKIKKEKE